MPKSTFYRLSDEKKNRILKAARQEFLRVPFEEASINQIIKAAEIPRGSFYQYFEDKQDVFLYLLEEHQEKIVEDTIRQIRLAEGDFFRFVLQFLDHLPEFFRENACGQNFFSLLDGDNLSVICGFIRQQEEGNAERMQETEQKIIAAINFDLLRVENEEEGRQLMSIVGALMRDTFSRMIQLHGRNQEEILCAELRQKIQLLEKTYRKS